MVWLKHIRRATCRTPKLWGLSRVENMEVGSLFLYAAFPANSQRSRHTKSLQVQTFSVGKRSAKHRPSDNGYVSLVTLDNPGGNQEYHRTPIGKGEVQFTQLEVLPFIGSVCLVLYRGLEKFVRHLKLAPLHIRHRQLITLNNSKEPLEMCPRLNHPNASSKSPISCPFEDVAVALRLTSDSRR